jgi:predicted transposase YdaD
MNSLGYEYQSDFARRYYGQGKAEGRMEGRAEGKTEGRMELTLKLLALRFGPLFANLSGPRCIPSGAPTCG